MSSVARPVRRVRRVLRPAPADVALPPVARPLGAKLELTHRCNLRCDFCYTDSPRATLDRTVVDMDDAAWMSAVDELVELGVMEAVLTGGEPLLRRGLALGMAERLSAARVSVMFNTNGWHLDEATARRLAALEGLRVHVSIDGPTPEVHDSVRGVPGSWRRAMAAVDRLIRHGVAVTVVHVVVPGGEQRAGELLDVLWSLGVSSARVAGVSQAGAAAGRRWTLDEPALRRATEVVRPGLSVQLIPVGVDPELYQRRKRLEQLLVRPNGDVVIDSVRPVVFGTVREDGLGACWERIRTSTAAERERPADHMPYRDPDVRRDGRRPPSPRAAELTERARRARARVPAIPSDGGDLAAATDAALALALARPYQWADVRATSPLDGERYVHVPTQRSFHRLSPRAAEVMDVCDGGHPGMAVEQLASRYPDVERSRLTQDVLGTVRDLVARRIIAPVA